MAAPVEMLETITGIAQSHAFPPRGNSRRVLSRKATSVVAYLELEHIDTAARNDLHGSAFHLRLETMAHRIFHEGLQDETRNARAIASGSMVIVIEMRPRNRAHTISE